MGGDYWSKSWENSPKLSVKKMQEIRIKEEESIIGIVRLKKMLMKIMELLS